jgi:hypothetical protein
MSREDKLVEALTVSTKQMAHLRAAVARSTGATGEGVLRKPV